MNTHFQNCAAWITHKHAMKKCRIKKKHSFLRTIASSPNECVPLFRQHHTECEMLLSHLHSTLNATTMLPLCSRSRLHFPRSIEREPLVNTSVRSLSSHYPSMPFRSSNVLNRSALSSSTDIIDQQTKK